MKSKILILFFLFSFLGTYASSNVIFGEKDSQVVHLNMQKKKQTRLDEPIVLFDTTDNTLTVNFDSMSCFGYVVTISSPLVDVDYYATSPFTTIPIAVDGINDYNIIIETDDGDIFEGTLLATDCHPTERL